MDTTTPTENMLHYLRIPTPSHTTVVIGLSILGGMFVAAILIDYIRRVRTIREDRRYWWRNADTLMTERGLSEDEKRLTRMLIERSGSKNPQTVVSARRDFNHAVDVFMQAVARTGDQERFRKLGLSLRDIRSRLGLDFVPAGFRIEHTRELFRGQVISLTIHGQRPPHWFPATMVALDEACMTLTGDAETAPKLTRDLEIRCHLWREDDARYTFLTRIAEIVEDPPQIILEHGYDLQRVQTRQYYRMRYNQAASVGYVYSANPETDPDIASKPAANTTRGRITSVSAGGLAIELPEAPPMQALLRTVLDLSDIEPITVTIKVVDHVRMANSRFLVRGPFTGISEEHRDAISQYVFRRQQPVIRREDGISES